MFSVQLHVKFAIQRQAYETQNQSAVSDHTSDTERVVMIRTTC